MFNINCTGLRFFSVYGPWGRPDMAAYIFTKNLFENKPLDLFNFGRMERDFTFVDDLINGVTPLIKIKKRMQLGDVRHTYANIKESKKDLKFKLKTNLEGGLEKFVSWYKEYHNIY